MLVETRVISRKGQSELVEWDTDRGVRRAYLPSGLVVDGEADPDVLSQGIPYGGLYLEILLDSRFSSKAECIAKALERAGMTTLNDLANAPRIVGHICGEDIYQIVAVLTTTSEQNEV